MTLQPGTRLGPYEIVAPIGAGGMGEVYRGRDTRLDRTVAVKILPAELANDARFKIRFEREAKAISALNDPHICTLYDVGDSYLVMEFCDGQTLADRLARGPLPLEQVIDYGSQIAEALDKAHRSGILHRDLKPSNIMVTKSGVKLLDFGLAKREADVSLTLDRQVVGTLGYMAPEVLAGKEADVRSDIYALGRVLRDMIGPSSDARLERLIATCIASNPDARMQSAHDVAVELRWIGEHEKTADRQSTLPWFVAAAAIAVAAFFAVSHFIERPLPHQETVTRTTLDIRESAPIALGKFPPPVGYFSTAVALSPDSSQVIYVGSTGARTQLFKRRLDREEVEPIPGSEGAQHAFFSPDGTWLGVITSRELRKMPLKGGAPVVLAKVENAIAGVWLPQDEIFVKADGGVLFRISAQGGELKSLSPQNMSDVFPDGTASIVNGDRTSGRVCASGDFGNSNIVDLASGTVTHLLDHAFDVRYVQPDMLVFARGGDLLAVRFDLKRRAVVGDAVVIASGVAMNSFFRVAQYAVSRDALAYVGGSDTAMGKLAWIDRSGKTKFLPAPEQRYVSFRLSPDDRRIAVHVADVQDFIWLYDITRNEGRQIASSVSAGWPLWTSDGNHVIAISPHGQRGVSVVEMDAIDGQPPRELGWIEDSLGGLVYPRWISPDGRFVALRFSTKEGVRSAIVDLRDPHAWSMNRQRPVGTISPDGRWYADLNRGEIWVGSRDPSGARYQISNGGGIEAVWCRSCPELYYRNGSQWYAAAVSANAPLRIGPRTILWQTDFIDAPGVSYDVSKDGSRLLVSKRAREDVLDRIHIVRNWAALLQHALDR